jgi:hypothetical protein
MSRPPRIWERLQGEGEVPYELFQIYLRCKKPRTYDQVADQSGRAYQTIAGYGTKFEWIDRARAYDNAGVRAEDNAVLNARAKITKEELEAIRAMRILGTAEIKRRIKMFAGDPDGNHGVSARDAVALLKEAIVLERLILGEATERTEKTVKSLDLSKLDSERAQILMNLLDEVGAFDE